jgi:hypothetical protein
MALTTTQTKKPLKRRRPTSCSIACPKSVLETWICLRLRQEAHICHKDAFVSASRWRASMGAISSSDGGEN